MSVTTINTASAIFLESQATGAPILVPVTDIAHPELARLLMIRLERGSVPKHEYDQSRAVTGWTKRHLQRQLAALFESNVRTETPSRAKFQLTDRHKQLIMACSSVRLAYKQLVESGEDLPSFSTFWRGYDALESGVRGYLRHGAQGMVGMWLYPPFQAPTRNNTWQADHFELPMDVIADRSTTTLVKPWLTVFQDDRTRMVMSWALVARPGERPGADVVCATICDGIRIRYENDIEVGGVPSILRWDNDLSFKADSVTQLGVAVGFECHAVPPYSGHMKGKIERLGRRVQEEFCVVQPGFTHGPVTYTGRDPFRNTPPLHAEELRERLAIYFAKYNQTLHEGINATPLSVWAEDPTPLQRATDAQLRSALLVAPKLHRVIVRKGVHFKGCFWQGAGMLDIVGRQVEVRYPINDDSFIELFYDGKWSCTAWPALTLTDAQKKAIWTGRKAMYAEVRELHTMATELRVGADARTLVTDATPSIASMPAIDRLASNPSDLYALLGRLDESDDDTEQEGDTREGRDAGPAVGP